VPAARGRPIHAQAESDLLQALDVRDRRLYACEDIFVRLRR
jgi:hypothetical protein